MRTFSQKQNQPQKSVSSSLARPNRATLGPDHREHPILHLQRTIGNQAVLRMLQTHAEEPDVGLTAAASPRFGYDFSRIPVHAPAAGAIQTKLAINQPGDIYEQEADRIADQVLAAPAHPAANATPPSIQRFSGQSNAQLDAAPASVDQALASRGRPLESALRQDIEQRFGYDFSRVRVHSDAAAEQSAEDANAQAYTVGHDIVFGARRFAPETSEGRRLIAHELTHVLQQSGGDGMRADQVIQRQPEDDGATGAGPGPVTQGAGNVSVYVGKTMTSEAALREIYRQSAREVSEEALRIIAQGTSVEDAARWAHQARNDLKVLIRARGSAIIRGFAEARNVRKYGNKIGPSFEELIRQGKTPEDIIGSAGRASAKVNRVATRLKVGGRFFIGLDIAIVTWEVFSAPEGEGLRTAVGGGGRVAGALGVGWAGAKGGAAVGSFFGPIGTGVGGFIGGIGGAFLGGWLGGKAAEKTYDLIEDLVNPPSGSIGDLQSIVIDGIEDAYIRTQTQRRP